MDNELMSQIREMVEEKAQKGLERFEKICDKCHWQCKLEDNCIIGENSIKTLFFKESVFLQKEYEDIMNQSTMGVMRPTQALYYPRPPSSTRYKVLFIAGVENDQRMGIFVIREMTKRSRKFWTFLFRVGLYLKDYHRYAEDENLFEEIFGEENLPPIYHHHLK